MCAASYITGCCGFPTSRARYYAGFRVVEVQTTFYEPPRQATARRWRREAPPDFEFTLKAWQVITHEPSSPTWRRLRTTFTQDEKRSAGAFRLNCVTREAWRRTLAIARALGADKVLFQCPAGFRPTAENMDRMHTFFRAIERDGLTLLWEPRGEWTDAQIKEICRKCGLTHCVDPFVRACVTDGLRYYRLHGLGSYAHRFSDEELIRLRDMLPAEGACYILFNNRSMLDDAMRFREMIGV